MFTAGHLLMILTSLLAILSYSSAFWFAAEEPKPTSPRVLYSPDYYRQYVPPPPPIPYGIPLQMSAPVQNVQLVPCLCPVSQEYSYENGQEFAGRKSQPLPQQRRK